MMGKDSCPVVVYPQFQKNRRQNVQDVSESLMARNLTDQAAQFRRLMNRSPKELDAQIVRTGQHPITYAAEKVGVQVEWRNA